MHLSGPETSRLTHRAFEPDDAAVFYRLNTHPDVMRYTCDDRPASEAAARQAIVEYPDFREHGFGRWACILKATGQVIGFCGLKFLSEVDSVDVGYRFFPEYWGQGFATEACRASVTFGFQELNLPVILAFVKAENAASRRVVEKVGFHDCGLTSVGDVCAHRFECYRSEQRDD